MSKRPSAMPTWRLSSGSKSRASAVPSTGTASWVRRPRGARLAPVGRRALRRMGRGDVVLGIRLLSQLHLVGGDRLGPIIEVEDEDLAVPCSDGELPLACGERHHPFPCLDAIGDLEALGVENTHFFVDIVHGLVTTDEQAHRSGRYRGRFQPESRGSLGQLPVRSDGVDPPVGLLQSCSAAQQAPCTGRSTRDRPSSKRTPSSPYRRIPWGAATRPAMALM